MSKRFFCSQATTKMMRNRSQRTLERKMDGEPIENFIQRGTEGIMIGENKMAEFCPHIDYCSRQSIDTNCFYLKFLSCYDARRLEKTHPLSQIDKFYVRYR